MDVEVDAWEYNMTIEDRIYLVSENLHAIATLIENGGYDQYDDMVRALGRQHTEMYSLLLDMDDGSAEDHPITRMNWKHGLEG